MAQSTNRPYAVFVFFTNASGSKRFLILAPNKKAAIREVRGRYHKRDVRKITAVRSQNSR